MRKYSVLVEAAAQIDRFQAAFKEFEHLHAKLLGPVGAWERWMQGPLLDAGRMAVQAERLLKDAQAVLAPVHWTASVRLAAARSHPPVFPSFDPCSLIGRGVWMTRPPTRRRHSGLSALPKRTIVRPEVARRIGFAPHS